QRGLAPLHTLASQISSRDQGNLEPLASQGVPAEVSVMVAEINALFCRLKATLERFSRFTANVSHELRTPISGIITHAHLALNSQQETARRKSLSNVIKGSKRLNHTLDQLLTLARIDPDQLRDSFSQVDLRSTAIEVISECSPAALKKNLELELLGDGPSFIQGNEELTSILLRNLIGNAINATPSGGHISVSLDLTPQGPLLQVEDTGPGVPEAERNRIFERFYRLPESPAQGSGLGLSIVQTIVTIHAGSISLTPREQGSGLRVSIQYPAQY
ncbi:MAG: ATP-binding protein, partial [Pseudomonadota bacterium]